MVLIKFLCKIETPSSWGSQGRGLEGVISVARCSEAKGYEYPCVPPTYIKGILRRKAYLLLKHLVKLNLISLDTYVKLFGPTTIESRVNALNWFGSEPSCIRVSQGIIVDRETAEEITKKWPSVDSIVKSDVSSATVVEPHIRIRDEVGSVAVGALYSEERVKHGYYVYWEVEVVCKDIECQALALLLYSSLLLRYTGGGRGYTVLKPCINVEPHGVCDERLGNVLKLVRERWCANEYR